MQTKLAGEQYIKLFQYRGWFAEQRVIQQVGGEEEWLDEMVEGIGLEEMRVEFAQK